MREIKFRAWHRNDQLMFNWFDLIQSAHNSINGKFHIMFEVHTNGHFDLMQFTGLHDVNGKEIYEGDLFKLPWKWPIYEVVYHPLYAYFGLRGQGTGHIESFSDIYSEDVKLEVIGNIYENPELIKEEDHA